MSHSGCSFLAVLFWLSNPVWAILSCLSFSAYPVIPVLFCLPCSAYPTLTISLCLSSSACPVQDPCFPPAERLWALKPDFHCGGTKKCEFALFSFALGAFAFFSGFFSLPFCVLFLASRSRAQKRKKSAAARLWFFILFSPILTVSMYFCGPFWISYILRDPNIFFKHF
jgi:hypothetical protein